MYIVINVIIFKFLKLNYYDVILYHTYTLFRYNIDMNSKFYKYFEKYIEVTYKYCIPHFLVETVRGT